MSLRNIVPLAFLLLLATSSLAVGLLGDYNASAALWWMNQEVYSRLRGIFYMTELLPIGPFELAAILVVSAAVLVAFGRSERAAFMANHIALVTAAYAGLFHWKVSVAMQLPFTPNFSLLIASRIDLALAIGVFLALASTASCHWLYLSAPFRRLSRGET
jgi:hypothetical protein